MQGQGQSAQCYVPQNQFHSGTMGGIKTTRSAGSVHQQANCTRGVQLAAMSIPGVTKRPSLAAGQEFVLLWVQGYHGEPPLADQR